MVKDDFRAVFITKNQILCIDNFHIDFPLLKKYNVSKLNHRWLSLRLLEDDLSAKKFIEKFPEGRPWFDVSDLELVNYWVYHNLFCFTFALQPNPCTTAGLSLPICGPRALCRGEPSYLCHSPILCGEP